MAMQKDDDVSSYQDNSYHYYKQGESVTGSAAVANVASARNLGGQAVMPSNFITDQEIDDEFDAEAASATKMSTSHSKSGRSFFSSSKVSTSTDNEPTINLRVKGPKVTAAAAASAAAAAAAAPENNSPPPSSRELPLPDDTYDETFKQIVKTQNNPQTGPLYNKRQRCIVVIIVSICLVTFALTIGIFFGLKRREASVRSGENVGVQNAQPKDNKCCSRDGNSCASEFANLCTSETQCTSTCEGQWIIPTGVETQPPPPPPSGCCSVDGGFSCDYVSFNTTESKICSTQKQACETNTATCLGGTWIDYCCSTDGQYCNTQNVPNCNDNNNPNVADVCSQSCQGTFGPFSPQPPPLAEGCCSYDGGVVCGQNGVDGNGNGLDFDCDTSKITCEQSCGGSYKPTRNDGCCSRDFGQTCDSIGKSGSVGGNGGGNGNGTATPPFQTPNRLPDFCDSDAQSCEGQCGGLFKLPPPPFEESDVTTAPTPAPTPPPAVPEMPRLDQLKELLKNTVSSSNPAVLERDSLTGLSMTPQAKALDWLLNADGVVQNIFQSMNGTLGIVGPSASARTNNSYNANSTITTRFTLATMFFATTTLPTHTWTNSQGWLSDDEHCTWYGVTCQPSNLNNGGGNTNKDPNEVDLGSVGANGNAVNTADARSTSIVPVPEFRPILALSLGGNGLKGPALQNELFQSLGSSLIDLDLRDNEISGSLGDTLMEMTQLEVLSLFNNSIVGTLPAALGFLTKLKKLYLEENGFTGSLPDSIGNMTSLQRMDLYGNQLVGGIPSTVSKLTNLQRLWLSRNKLNGSIPASIGNCFSLKELYLDDNSLIGSLPSEVSQLTQLQDFRAYNNKLTGSLPRNALQFLSNLQILYLDNNNLVGSVPSAFPPSLRELSLFNNTLTGSIPSTLGSSNSATSSPLPNLQVLALSLNKLSGSIPASFNNLKSLRILHLYNNSLAGPMPNLSGMSELRDFFVQNNSIQGNIPSWIYNVSGSVNLGYNNLSGNLPFLPSSQVLTQSTSSAQSYSLRSLKVEGNPGLSGQVPPSVCAALQPSLETFTVSCSAFGQASCVTGCV